MIAARCTTWRARTCCSRRTVRGQLSVVRVWGTFIALVLLALHTHHTHAHPSGPDHECCLPLRAAGATSVAWNNELDDMLCFSGNGTLKIKTGTFPVHTQKMPGVVVGFSGSRIFVLHEQQMQTVDVPQGASLYRYLEAKEYAMAYKVACLGVTDADWRLLATEAIRAMQFDIAREAFIRVRDMRAIDLLCVEPLPLALLLIAHRVCIDVYTCMHTRTYTHTHTLSVPHPRSRTHPHVPSVPTPATTSSPAARPRTAAATSCTWPRCLPTKATTRRRRARFPAQTLSLKQCRCTPTCACGTRPSRWPRARRKAASTWLRSPSSRRRRRSRCGGL